MRGTKKNLRFPRIFRALRVRSGLMQKVAALELGIDTAVLCSAEKGARSPLPDRVIAEAADLYRITPDELSALKWAAHHDRLIASILSGGGGDDEIELISASLSAWYHLGINQRSAWLATVKRMDESARAVASLSLLHVQEEDAMT